MPSVDTKAECLKVLLDAFGDHLDQEHRRSLPEGTSIVDRIISAIGHDANKATMLREAESWLSNLPTPSLRDVARQHRKPPGKRGAKVKQFEDLADAELDLFVRMHDDVIRNRKSIDVAAANAAAPSRSRSALAEIARLKKFYQRWHKRAHTISNGKAWRANREFMALRSLSSRFR